MKRRLLTGLLACCVFFAVGCGQAKQAPNTITVWHWMTDRHKALETLAQQYYAETGVTVNFQLFAPSDVYSQKITAAAQARILPDIFGILDKKSVLADFINAGFVLNLKDDYQADDHHWEKVIFDKALAANRFEKGNVYGVEEGIYGVPLDVANIQMVYNKILLAKAGVKEPPKTFEEFLKAAEKIKALGVAPLVSGWSELWLVDCFALNYALNIMGEEKLMATYRGDVPYTDPDWIAVFTIFQTLSEEGVLDSGIVIKSNKDAEQDFALERAAFAFNGSWCVNVYHGMNPDLHYGVMLPPFLKTQQPVRIWGSAGGSFVVNARSPRKDKAVAFLKWLTAKQQQIFLSEATQNLPANRYALIDLPKELKDFGSAMDLTTHPTIWPVEEDALVKEKFTKGIQSIIIGEKTPQELAKEVQAMKERQMERARRRKR